MPAKLIVIHANDFITVTAQGDFDFEESKKALAKVAIAAGPLTDYEILLDTRRARSRLNLTELRDLAVELAAHGAAFGHKTAVLCPPERFDDTEFFALCAERRGLQVCGFTSFEAAMAWLTDIPDNSPEATAGV